jgi:type I restriction-modification system DNA methylase subunit
MIETAREGTGRVGVVVPHGVLFRGAAEGKIRQKLTEENLLQAVIGLPANLFIEDEAQFDLDAVVTNITRLESELTTVRAKLQAYLEELGV